MARRLLHLRTMRSILSRSAVLVLLATTAACEGSLPPPPILTVTSPARGLVQEAGQVVVKGIALPNPNGDRVTNVTVNRVPAILAADGSFTATIDIPTGATLLETVAISEYGGAATDARAVHIGRLQPVGTNIDRALTAALSTDAFARLSAAAGPIIKSLDLPALLAPMQPMVSLGDSIANLKLSINNLTLGDIKISLTPVDGGLAFSAEIDGLGLAATADYNAVISSGSTLVSVTADKITIAGTLVVTPAGTAGFTTTIASPNVQTANLKLKADGLVGQVFDLLNSNLASSIQSIITSTAAQALQPLINDAFGALAGPQHITVMGKDLELQTSPSTVAFTAAGALVTMNLAVKIRGSESSPGFIFTANGTPTMDASTGIQLGLADDLLNEMLAEIHALGLLDLHLAQDFGAFDTIDLKLAMPPMVSANNSDGTLRLVLGDMIATVGSHGKPLLTAAINAQVDLAILRGNTAQQIALQFGKVDLWVNIIPDPSNPASGGADDLFGAAATGIGLQLDSLSQFLITVPLPSVAGVSLDHLSMHADSGYVLMSGEIH